MANPAFNEKTLQRMREYAGSGSMTIHGTINKTGILLLCLIAGAVIGWGSQSALLVVGSMIGAFILSLLVIFNPARAAYLSQAYAVLEGVLLGAISAMYSARFPGIVSNAMIGTISVLGVMLALYRFNVVRNSEKFRTVIMGATMAIGITYLVDMVMSFFGTHVSMIHESSPMGIAFSVVVVAVAAFNLILDFDFIEQAEQQNAPKYMEWYGGFALLVTLVWLYLEILRLLSKMNKK